MKHKEYLSRVQNLVSRYMSFPLDYVPEGDEKEVQQLFVEALTQLFQDFKDAVIGEKEAIDYDFGDEEADTRNNLRQSQHQTANNILEGK